MPTPHPILSMTEHEQSVQRERDEFFFRSWAWWTALPPLIITVLLIAVLLALGAGRRAFILAVLWSPVVLFVFMLLSIFLAMIAESTRYGPRFNNDSRELN